MSKTTITAGELEQVGIALNGVFARDLPIKVSYALAKLTREVEKELKVLNEIRQKLVKTHALHNEGNEPLVIENPDTKQKITVPKGQPITARDPVTKLLTYTFENDEIKETYLKDLAELLKMKIEIDHLMIPLDALNNVSFSPVFLKTIMFMIDDGSKLEEKK